MSRGGFFFCLLAALALEASAVRGKVLDTVTKDLLVRLEGQGDDDEIKEEVPAKELINEEPSCDLCAKEEEDDCGDLTGCDLCRVAQCPKKYLTCKVGNVKKKFQVGADGKVEKTEQGAKSSSVGASLMQSWQCVTKDGEIVAMHHIPEMVDGAMKAFKVKYKAAVTSILEKGSSAKEFAKGVSGKFSRSMSSAGAMMQQVKSNLPGKTDNDEPSSK